MKSGRCSETGTKRNEKHRLDEDEVGEEGRKGAGRGRCEPACWKEKLIPNDRATRNGKKIFCREVRASPSCNHPAHVYTPSNHHPPSPTDPLVIPGEIGFTFRRELVRAHISFLPCVLLRTLLPFTLCPLAVATLLLLLPSSAHHSVFREFSLESRSMTMHTYTR